MKKPIGEWKVCKLFLAVDRFVLKLLPMIVMLLLAGSVIMRYILKMDLYGIEEIMAIVAMWMYMLGAAYGSYEKSHIRADIIDTFVKSEKIAKGMKALEYVIVITVLVVFSKWGIEYAQWNIHAGNRTAYWKFPTLLSQIPITIGMLLMLLHSSYHGVIAIRSFIDVMRCGKEEA